MGRGRWWDWLSEKIKISSSSSSSLPLCMSFENKAWNELFSLSLGHFLYYFCCQHRRRMLLFFVNVVWRWFSRPRVKCEFFYLCFVSMQTEDFFYYFYSSCLLASCHFTGAFFFIHSIIPHIYLFIEFLNNKIILPLRVILISINKTTCSAKILI